MRLVGLLVACATARGTSHDDLNYATVKASNELPDLGLLLLALNGLSTPTQQNRHSLVDMTSKGLRGGSARMADDDVTEHFDYLVIGGGSGGIGSARRAAQHGAKVAVIERDRLGGTCVNVGCVPKKCMFNAGMVQEIIHQAAGYGFKVDGYSFSLPDFKKKRDAYVARLNGIYANNMANSGITSITGDATFVGERKVKVGDKTYSAEHVLIAVGGKPLMPPIPGIELAIESNGFF
jgi:hypothetical protein